MDAREAAERIERELLILTRHKEMRAPRGPRGGDPLDQSAYVLLNRIETQGPMSIPDFVEAFGLAASTFTRQTSALLRNGLVERALDPAGGVARKFRITEEGVRLLSEQREGIVTGLSTVVADWTPDRLDRFIADLRQFNTDIERITGRPWPRNAEDTADANDTDHDGRSAVGAVTADRD
ncbi:DNA-binding transcriptional regulator, MarR family [Streptomyces sp. cf386]|uniref:MarR family winged helix-turn-helix transcriptional regulator n=1 Tax=Streptomyces sp. cf386 TaxID=1761904 RepID=UPI00088A195A|nr:MarR family transcriptional regulator [Streptomyces sp. cf386]SDN31747.1 DNA-binding transcriptional regulator, MarR family [Streptomyces sp. cf386]